MWNLWIVMGISILLGAAGYFIFKYRRLSGALSELKDQKSLNEAILRSVGAYVVLINDRVEVLRSNYYTVTQTEDPGSVLRLGELFNCKNGLDAGHCGEHMNCPKCKIRNAIVGAFAFNQPFKEIEEDMVLYKSRNKGDVVECTVSVSGVPLEVAGERCQLITLYDITRYRKMQRELEQETRLAQESSRLKSRFLTNISHEIRTPLNSIVGFGQLLAANNDTPQNREYVQIINRNSAQLSRMIQYTLDLSRIEIEGVQKHLSEERVYTICQEVEEEFLLQMDTLQSPVSFIFDPSDKEIVLNTDAARLRQILSHLLNNAIQNTRQGSIHFGYEVREKTLFFYVTDTGIGISEEDQTRLFDRFFQVDEHHGGTGIGLTIVKRIVEGLNGNIGVESRVGEGSKFWFTLPR